MSMQISLKLSDKMFSAAKKFVDIKGFDNLQDFIRETIREKLFDNHESFGGKYTSFASERSLAKNWSNKGEDRAWKHLEKEI